jgi:hypothetical protein
MKDSFRVMAPTRLHRQEASHFSQCGRENEDVPNVPYDRDEEEQCFDDCASYKRPTLFACKRISAFNDLGIQRRTS